MEDCLFLAAAYDKDSTAVSVLSQLSNYSGRTIRLTLRCRLGLLDQIDNKAKLMGQGLGLEFNENRRIGTLSVVTWIVQTKIF